MTWAVARKQGGTYVLGEVVRADDLTTVLKTKDGNEEFASNDVQPTGTQPPTTPRRLAERVFDGDSWLDADLGMLPPDLVLELPEGKIRKGKMTGQFLAYHEASVAAGATDEELGVKRDYTTGRFARQRRGPLSPREEAEGREALGEYAGTGPAMNYALRTDDCTGGSRTVNCSENAPRLDRFIAGQEDMPEGAVFWRGVARFEDSDFPLPGDFDPASWEVGDELTDKGFLSMTEDRLLAESFGPEGDMSGALLEITVRRPQPMADVADADYEDGTPDWSEFVAGRNSRVRITGERIENGMRVLSADLV